MNARRCSSSITRRPACRPSSSACANGRRAGAATWRSIDLIQIKEHKSAQTKAIHKLTQWSAFTGEPFLVRYVRILTGRPQTQGPHDLWGQLRTIGLFPKMNFYAFRGSFCVMGGYILKEVVQAKNTEALAEIMAPVVFQAKKKDWLPNLPHRDDDLGVSDVW